jgi:hypothetical protein
MVTLCIVAAASAARVASTLVAFDNARGLLSRSGYYVLADLPDPLVTCALLCNAYFWYAIVRKIDLARSAQRPMGIRRVPRAAVKALFAALMACVCGIWLAGELAAAAVAALDPGFRAGVLIAMFALVLVAYAAATALVVHGVQRLRRQGHGGVYSRIVVFLVILTSAVLANLVLVALLVGGVTGSGDATPLLAVISVVTGTYRGSALRAPPLTPKNE